MKFLLILVLFSLTGLYAQNDLKVVRLSSEIEAWLAGDKDKTLESFLKQEKTGKIDAVDMYNIGYLYFLRNEYKKALTYFQTAVLKEPSYPYPYLQISRIYRNIGNLHAAQDHLERGLDTQGDNIDLLLEMADVCKKLNETDKALEFYKEVLDNDEENVPAIVNIARIYFVKGNFYEADKILKEHADVYPEASILLIKAEIAEATGALEKSKNYLRQIVTDYPNSTKWQHIRDSLRIKYNISEVQIDTSSRNYKYKIDLQEELDYKVTYGPMTLGWLKVRVGEPEEISGKKIVPLIFFVDTNPSYGFVLTLHHIYESYINPLNLNAYKSRTYTPGAEDLVKTYYYDYDQNIFTAYIIHDDGRLQVKQKDLPRKVQDATSMLYFARALVSNKSSGVTTVVIDEDYKYGSVKFLNETEKIEIGNQNVEAFKIFARAEFEGVAGMNGDAWGWFSKDDDCVPLKGAIEIIVGSISVEVDDEKTEIPDFHEDARK
jgi:Tfp pilus assembly protein PilF